MKRAGSYKDLFLPWAGLVFGFLGWWLAHEFGYAASFDSCEHSAPLPVICVTLLCIAAAIGGAWASSAILRGQGEGTARRVIATISVGIVGLFVLAMLLPVIATLILPPCFQ